jgi:hypothetical protein
MACAGQAGWETMPALSRCRRLLQVTGVWYRAGVMHCLSFFRNRAHGPHLWRLPVSLAATALIAAAGIVACAPAPAAATPGGLLKVLLKGYWACEAMGDATAPPKPQPQDSFDVIADSSYRTVQGATGSYLLLDQTMTMTSGPFRGRSYILVGQGILHPVDATGRRSTNRCVRQRSAGATGDDTARDNSES